MNRFNKGDFELEFLDPVADRRFLGDRFCWGASLWQLRDQEGRELLSGPEYPHTNPIPFNNQGFPEVFRNTDKHSGKLLNIDSHGRGLVIGVGQVHIGKNAALVVDRPCTWDFSEEGENLVWRTSDCFGDWAYDLERRWIIRENKLTSFSKMESSGSAVLDIHWYPHPFFPLVEGGTAFSVDPEVEADGNSGGFEKRGKGYRSTTVCDREGGCFEWLNADYGDRLQWTVEHPLCGSVRVEGNFHTSYMPVWCNENTISLEPYMTISLDRDKEVRWDISFTFGG